jgi:PAS domain S-box-containing protein
MKDQNKTKDALIHELTELRKRIAEMATLESERRQAEETYRTVFENTGTATIIFEEDMTISLANRGAEKLSGYTKEEIEGKRKWTEFVSKDDLELMKKYHIMRRADPHSVPKNYEFRMVDRYGKRKDVFLIIDMIPGTRKSIASLLDITERKEAEEALRRSEAELHENYFTQFAINQILSESLEDISLELMLQKALNIILTIPWLSFESIGSIHLTENESGLLAMKAQYNLHKQLRTLCAHLPFGKCLCGRAALTQQIQFAGCTDERHEICYDGMISHGHYIVPIVFGKKTLGVLNIYLKEGHIRSQQEEEFLRTVADTLAGIIIRKHSEGEKEKLHAQLLQSQKMEAVGQLAGGISHDFNNILTAMTGYAHILKMKMSEDDPRRKYTDNLLSLSDRAANLIQSLLAFSRKQISNPRPVNINEVIRTVEKLLLRLIGEDIRVEKELTENNLVVMADVGQLEQVLMNLATNARDAMPAGGLLSIRTDPFDINHEFIKEHGFGEEARYALISVTDTGAGMDRETSGKIFEPFFTTKEVGKGTGLGLAMVYGIIKQHNGYINVYSEPGHGTTFRIYLPLTQAKEQELKPEVTEPVSTDSATILLAEDEAVVREFTKKLLEEYGYTVIEAIDGEDAIEKFKMHRDAIQLLILDAIMPKKTAREVYGEIIKVNPGIKVLFTSGYPADIVHKDNIEAGFDFIEKPVSPIILLKKVRDALDK